MNNRQTLIFMAVVAALMGALALYQFFQPPRWNGSHISPPAPMPGFSLQSAAGAVDLQQFAGKYVILYFGYTGCPDVCPTTLAGLREALRRLGANADKFQVIFVSVDPARDTPQIASAYAARFNPAFLGLTGSAEEIAATAKAFGVYYKLNDPDPKTGFYTVDHSASVLVLDRQGALILTWPYGLTPVEIEEDLRNLLRQ
ncbi:MAG: hypothetical protein CO094_02900 [Anaerolineae bacterium CG_4_9_14_3_um_filter_57_17]|nr:SCO family protein [bacterium]NCT21363.1 SCO family protein [bacterium]OIO83711.1 MAG: hypothetical protein AUK01_11890 [Anaerolineae bacterium CG2_30_57_67]PJB67812.1 MAG: hypothetical protein CO094_02900 [Anaerolineae bacterium CG_4_9_14_3_um_filter_57_17]